MVQFLELPRARSTGEKLMEGLGLVSQSIPDLIGSYQKKKSLDQIGSTLPEHQKKIWDSLGIEMQEKLAPGIFTAMQKKASEGEKIPFGAAKYLKEFHPVLYEDPKAKQAIGELAQKYFSEGSPETDSFRKATQDYLGKKTLSGTEETGSNAGFGMLPEGENKESALQWLTKERGNVDPATGKDISGHQSILNLLSEPSTLKTPSILGALGIGQLGFGEDVATLNDPIQVAIKIGQKMGVLPQGPDQSVSGMLKEKLHQGKTSQEQKQLGAIEVAGAFIPIEGAIFGLTKIGKQAGFLKNAEKLAAKTGTTAEEAAQTILQQAQRDGIDLSKVAEGDKQQAGRLYNLSNRVSREAPATATELRMERAKPAEKPFPTKERIATRETQLKEFPKYEAEIAQDAAERAARAETRVPKTEVGRESQRLRAEIAAKEFPKHEEGYRKAIARVRALEDEVGKFSGAEKERIRALIEHSKGELKDAEFALKQARENLTGQSVRSGLPEMREAAQKKMLDISEKLEKGEEVVLKKADYNPEMIHKAKEISRKKTLPAVKQDDFYQQVHKEYADQYRKQLQKIEEEIKGLPKTMVSAEQYDALKKERDILKKLIDHAEAERTIHRHKLGLREAEERHKAAQRLSQMKKRGAQPKVEKVAREKIEEATRNPEGAAAEEIAAKAGVKKQDLASAFKEVREKTAEIGEKVKQGVPKSRLLRDIDQFAKELRSKNWASAFTKTPLGREILWTMVGVATEEFLGKKVPYSSFATLIGGRRGTAAYRALFLFAYRETKNHIIRESYKKAVKSQDEERAAKIRKEHPRLAKNASKELRI